MRKIYAGAVNPRTGALIFRGQAKGAEADLVPFTGYRPMGVALDMFRYAAFRDPDWDLRARNALRSSSTCSSGPILALAVVIALS